MVYTRNEYGVHGLG